MPIKQKNEHCCLNKIRKEIMDADADVTYVDFELSNIVSMNKSNRTIKTGQAIRIGLLKTKKNGEKIQKAYKTFISHDYCPFCGTKY